jgi:hypothetical protein
VVVVVVVVVGSMVVGPMVGHLLTVFGVCCQLKKKDQESWSQVAHGAPTYDSAKVEPLQYL